MNLEVVWCCYAHQNFTAMSVIANNVIRELTNLGIPVSYEVLNESEINILDYPIEVQNAINRKYNPENSIGITFAYPDIYYGAKNKLQTKVFVGYTGCDSTGGYISSHGNPWKSVCNDTCDYMLTPSHYSRMIMENLGVKKDIELFPHGIDLNIFKPVERNFSYPFTFVFTGELTKRKSAQDIIQSFIEFSGYNNPNFRLLLRANAHMKYLQGSEIEELSSKSNNIFVEWKNEGQDDLVKYINNGHVYLSCTRADWFNMPIFEALATACPVIANSSNGYWEFLKNFVIPINHIKEDIINPDDHPYLLGKWNSPDVQDLKLKMEYVYNNYDYEKQRALESSKYIHENFSWKKVTENYLIPFLEKVNKEKFQSYKKEIHVEKSMDSNRVTIGIPSKDRLLELSLLLQSLLFQTYQNFDVIIVNDWIGNSINENSTLNGLFKVLRDSGHELTIIQGDRKGPQYGGQRILEASKNELILRLDDDVSLRPTFIGDLVQVISSDSKIAAVGPIYLNPQEPIKNQMLPDISEEDRVKFGSVFWDKDNNLFLTGFLQNKIHKNNTPVKVQHLNSGFMYRKSVGIEIGGYCLELSKVGHREESDWSYRMFHAGYELYIVPNAIAWHFHPMSGGIRETLGDVHRKELWDHDEAIFLKRMEKLIPMNNRKDRGVGIVILTHGEHRDLKQVLNDIKMYTSHPHHIVVVNNDTSPMSRNLIEDVKDYGTLIQLEKEVSVSEARNIGAEFVFNNDMNYICFLDDDARILGRYNQTTDFLDYLYNRFNEIPDVGAVGPIYTWFDELKTHSISAACMFTSKKVWERVGGFDPVFGNKEKGTWGYEDVDFPYRIRLNGFKLRGIDIPDFPFYHKNTTNEEKPEWKEKGLIKAKELLLAKYDVNQIDKFARTQYPFLPYQMSIPGLKINVGSFYMHLDGFVNVDIQKEVNPDVCCDMREISKYFKPNSASLILISQCLEHVNPEEGESVLKQLRDILVPGGILIVEVPDCEDLDTKLNAGDLSKFDYDLLLHGAGKPHQHHDSTFTSKSLIQMLVRVGFRNPCRIDQEHTSDHWMALRVDSFK